MKKQVCLCFIVVLGLCLSCNQPKVESEENHVKKTASANKLIGTPVMTLADITKDFNSFWTYYSKYAQLSQDFPTQDEHGKAIDRSVFLEQINTGLYLPLVIYGKDGMDFRLAKIPNGAAKDIGLTIGNYANKELIYCKMEGKPIPKFSFKDLNGKLYTSENTNGKIVLFKCWFITCQACIEEMPALNELIAKYKDRDDILYISLAIDQAVPLKQFLTTTKFDYVTIPDQKNYMEKDLHIQMYPTHFIINKKGILVKVVDEEKVMEVYLEKELKK
jgi:peroxiredoxin